jgi:hypothetical protein
MKQLPAQQTHKEKEGRKEVGPAAAVGPAPVYHPTLCKWEGMRFFISFPAIGEKEGSPCNMSGMRFLFVDSF